MSNLGLTKFEMSIKNNKIIKYWKTSAHVLTLSYTNTQINLAVLDMMDKKTCFGNGVFTPFGANL